MEGESVVIMDFEHETGSSVSRESCHPSDGLIILRGASERFKQAYQGSDAIYLVLQILVHLPEP